jgi:hypothetical protein
MAQLAEDGFGHGRIERRFAASDGFNSTNQIIAADALQHIA